MWNLTVLRDEKEGKHRGGEGKTPVNTAVAMTLCLVQKVAEDKSWRAKVMFRKKEEKNMSPKSWAHF